MKKELFSETAEALKDIPNGTILKTRRQTAEGGALPTEQLETWTEGKGAIESFAVFPGIEVSLHRYAAERVRFRHAADGSVIAVNHCRTGRAGWRMRGGGTIYLGPGDLCIHSMDDCAESEIELPLGYYEGAAVAADLRALAAGAPEILREAGFDAREIYRRFCAGGSPFGIPSSASAEAGLLAALRRARRDARPILQTQGDRSSALHHGRAARRRRDNAVRLRADGADKRNPQLPHGKPGQAVYDRRALEKIPPQHFDAQSGIQSRLRAAGRFICQRAPNEARGELLRESGASVAEIARAVGYETQGKFTKAFKESVGETPAEYRRRQRG